MTDSRKDQPTGVGGLGDVFRLLADNPSGKPTAEGLACVLAAYNSLNAPPTADGLAGVLAAYNSLNAPPTADGLGGVLAAYNSLNAPPPASYLNNMLAGLAPRTTSPAPVGIAAAALNPLSPAALGRLLEEHRSRGSWNERFEHWEKPASVSETGTIERAQSNVLQALAGNSWLSGQGVQICRQGSYQNRTNVRTEADIDLRAQHPALILDYDQNVVVDCARSLLGLSNHSLTYQQIFDNMRSELLGGLRGAFGNGNVIPGNKAIRIKGITGSRAEVDVVPAIQYRRIVWVSTGTSGYYHQTEGVAILSTTGQWTLNYPEHHEANGIAKRAATKHRFKKITRIFKRLRADMADRKLLTASVPSFLVECLVYVVEDGYFCVETDDRYGRVRRVAHRMLEVLEDPLASSKLREINGIKPLFGDHQPWRRPDAIAFARAAVAHLGDH